VFHPEEAQLGPELMREAGQGAQGTEEEAPASAAHHEDTAYDQPSNQHNDGAGVPVLQRKRVAEDGAGQILEL